MKKAEQLAALVAILIGAPLVFFFARAMVDGAGRYREAPLRSLLGEEIFEQLAAGETTSMHYMGEDRMAPDFTLRDREGRPWRLRDHRGKVVVLNFWSITCQPCIEEMPTLEELAQIADEWGDVEVVGVSTDEGWNAVSTIFPEAPRMKILFDPDKAVVESKFGTRLYPETWIIDKDGVIRVRVDGAKDWSSPLAVDVIDSYR